METEVKEKIRVACLFENGKIRPLVFSWRKKTYKVLKIAFSYDKNIGREKIFFFSIETSGVCLEISFNKDSFVWEIEKVFNS